MPSDTTKSRHFVRAAVFALLANGYDLAINSYWSQATSDVVSQFQKDMMLPVTGKVDFSTWMALLISYGDKNRAHTACDTRFEITPSRLSQLKSMGIKAVGRYINGTDFKILREGEMERIIDGGLGLIPIYQEVGTSASDFNESIGDSQGRKAKNNARNFGIPYGSIIYFAVDYDAQDHEITSNIIPYFKGIKKALVNYRIGIYGTRNVCQRVSQMGLAVASYVSNMSSGFSGNLGFKMPDNWTFDQFDEVSIGDWAIDKVIYSGKHRFVTEKTDETEMALDNYDPDKFPIPSNNDGDNHIYIYTGETELDIKADGNFEDPNNKVIGKLKKGQVFSLIAATNGAWVRNIVFTTSNGAVAYGYIFTSFAAEIDESPETLNVSDMLHFKSYNYDVSTDKYVYQDHQAYDPADSGARLTRFTVKRPLAVFNYEGKNEFLLPVGSQVYVENNSGFPTVAGKTKPHHLMIEKYKVPGGTIQDVYPSLDQGERHGFVDLDFQNGSIKSTRSLW